METITVVHGTPISTHPQQDSVSASGQDNQWWDSYHRSMKTRLVDVKGFSGVSTNEEMLFYHGPDEASCGITPTLGASGWLVLTNNDDGSQGYSYCAASRIPIGAFIDYYLNGADPIVTSRSVCNLVGMVGLNEDVSAVQKKVEEYNCAFWDEENLRRLRELRIEYEKKLDDEGH